MANQNVPILDRQVEVKEQSIPNVQGAGQSLAESNNFLSTMGAKLAQTANSQLAVQLGYESGKNPHGDIGIPLTEFDKNFAESYNTQANSVLSLQGQKLLDDAHIEMSKAPRLTPELIAHTQQQLDVGLKNIAANAPTAIRGKLESTFASQTLNQVSQYNEKMLTQQREDAKNNLTAAIEMHTQQANELSMSGDYKGAILHENAAKSAADSGGNNRYFTPSQVKVAKETAEKARLNGQWINEYNNAEKNGRGEEFLKEFQNGTHGMTHEQYIAAGQAIIQQVNFNKTLRDQNENLKSQEMVNQIAVDPNSITPMQWKNFQNSVSRIKFDQVNFKLIQAQNKHQEDTVAQSALIANYGNSRVQANAPDKLKNATFNKLVANTMQQAKLSNKPIDQDTAEVQVAASSGATVPVFTQSLKNKLWSGDPAQMDSAIKQIHALKDIHQGHALTGLNGSDNALYESYEAARNPADPTVGARMIIENSQNLDPAVLKITDVKLANLIDVNTRQAKIDQDDWILKKFGFSKEGSVLNPFSRRVFDAPFMATHYAADILDKYKDFYRLTRGNETIAHKMTQEYVDNNYGQTSINGGKNWTLHPIEKTLGFESNDGVSFIHQDMIRQIEPKLKGMKESYDKKASNEYWTLEGMPQYGDALRMTKHERAALGTKTKTYDVNLIGNNFDQWDVSIMTAYGPRSLFLDSPALGITTYTPDRKQILDEYNKSPQKYSTTDNRTLVDFIKEKRKVEHAIK